MEYITLKNFYIKLYKKEFFWGVIMIFFSIFFPAVLLPYISKFYFYLDKSVEFWNIEYLIYASFYLVFFNTIKSFPVFFSVFLLMDSTEIKIKNKDNYFLKIIFGFLIIQFLYFIIYKLHYDMDYYFGKVAILEMLYISIHSIKKFKLISLAKRNFVLFFIFIGIQWLDITRIFSLLDYRNSGETLFELKTMAELMEASFLLDMLGFFSFFLLFSFSITILLIFLNHEKTKNIYESEKKMSATLSKLAIQEMENRYFKEIQYLVHDLKTPLFSISTLIEILSMQEENIKKLEYFNKIEKSLDRFNVMISEILRNNNKNAITTSSFFDFIFSYLSTHKCMKYIKIFNYCPEVKLKINKIVFSRAITNLIINSYEAILDKSYGSIKITIKNYKFTVLLTIEDNGIGMDKSKLKKIFKEGFSTKKSNGLGLSFVNTVIHEHKSKIYVTSKQMKGTKFFIIFGKEIVKYEK